MQVYNLKVFYIYRSYEIRKFQGICQYKQLGSFISNYSLMHKIIAREKIFLIILTLFYFQFFLLYNGLSNMWYHPKIERALTQQSLYLPIGVEKLSTDWDMVSLRMKTILIH